MNQEILEFYKKKIKELLDKMLIRLSKSPWICSIFYVQNQAKIERPKRHVKVVLYIQRINSLFQINRNTLITLISFMILLKIMADWH